MIFIGGIMPFLSLINFDPKNNSESYDDEINTIQRVDINKNLINLFTHSNESMEVIVLKESKNSTDEIEYQTLKPNKVDDFLSKVVDLYIDYLSKLGSKDEIHENFNEIHFNTLMYSEVISLLKLTKEYNRDHVRIRVSF